MSEIKEEKKTHRGCGGEVIWMENPNPKGSHWSFAGYCMKCLAFPITEEHIIFSAQMPLTKEDISRISYFLKSHPDPTQNQTKGVK